MLTCLNSHLLTYVPLPLTTSRHRQCLISHSFHYCIPAWCTLHCDYVSHPHWASTSILDIFTTSSLMLYACRSLSSQILFRNDPKLHPTSQIAPVNVLMPIFDSILLYFLQNKCPLRLLLPLQRTVICGSLGRNIGWPDIKRNWQYALLDQLIRTENDNTHR